MSTQAPCTMREWKTDWKEIHSPKVEQDSGEEEVR